MALLRKANIARPTAPAETVEVASLGGEVVVRGLSLSARLSIGLDGESGPYQRVPRILADSVVDADGEPIFDVQEWERFGSRHPDDALMLFGVAQRVSGLVAEDVEKN